MSKNSTRGFTPVTLRNLAQEYPAVSPTRNEQQFQVHNIGDRLGQEKVREILRRYGEGESARSLAQEYGVAPSALVRLLRENNVVVRRKVVSPETKALLVKEYEEGATVAELEDRHQLSHGSVLRALHRAGVQMRAKAPRQKKQ
ncbi:hypothetical protein [Leucobacter sp. NPDC077196]|uniref:hypothetical protein n=1 Tax=Leucobacter sp. NPDC077196 TaxID=3154959 RepID=UPI003416CD5E